MLNVFRKYSNSYLIYAIFGIIIFVFMVTFGPGSSGCGGVLGSSYAAKVNNEKIPVQEYLNLLRRYQDQFRDLGGLGGSPDMLEQRIRKIVIDSLIDKVLLSQQAKKNGFTISDKILLDYIYANTDGLEDFKVQDYRNWINNSLGMTVKRFEDKQRDDLLGKLMGRVIDDNINVSSDELKKSYTNKYNRVIITFVKIDPKEIFVTTPTTNILDVFMSQEGYEDRIKNYYEMNKSQYRMENRVRVRQILKALPKNHREEDVEKAKKELNQIKKRIIQGEEFSKLVQEYSDDTISKKEGGDMGFLEKGDMESSILDPLFQLKKPQILDKLVQSRQGIHLLELLEIQEGKLKEFPEVKKNIAEILFLQEEKEKIASKKAFLLLEELKSGEDIKNITWEESELIEAKAELEESDYQKNKRFVRIDSTWILKSEKKIQGIGESDALHKAIFNLTHKDPLLDKPYKVSGKFFVGILKERDVPTDKVFLELQDSLKEEFLTSKRRRIFRNWMVDVRKQATIVLNPSLFSSN